MTKLLVKSQVAVFTRKDGVMVQEHDNGKQGAVAPPHADTNSAKWGALPDHENPKHQLSGIGSKALGAAASGKDNLNHRAKVELASRGLDSDGNWLGFDKANEHHGISKEQASAGPDEVAGHFQTVHKNVLSAAAKGHLDLNKQAKHTLAARGHNSDGAWVGFAEAKKHHGIG